MRRRLVGLVVPVLAVLALTASTALAHDVTGVDAPGHGEGDLHGAMSQLFTSGPSASCPDNPVAPLAFDRPCINSDMAFWGDRAYQGHYGGFRIFDISNPASPAELIDFPCYGPQNDPVIWHNLLFLAVDRTMKGPECGAPATAHDDPNGWEGVRIFDVSNPTNPRFIKSVYTDCGAHTITLFPKNPAQIMLYVSSYPLRSGPTCGPERGPAAGNSPLHEKISVIQVPVNAPRNAKVVAEPRVSYPGDPDNKFNPAEHALPAFNSMTGCHDIAVFVELRMAAGACAEQAQLWRIRPNGIPDTRNPIWVFDDSTDSDGVGGGDAAVDFWHSATFSWDGKVVNFIDESFGVGCPPITPDFGSTVPTATTSDDADTGRMYFVDRRSGDELSQFTLPRTESAPDEEGAETAYCSAHLGNTVPARDKNLLVNAWYMGGVDVIDFTDPTKPVEVAFWDAGPSGPTGSDNWSAYWYEGPSLIEPSLTIYGTDGIHNTPTGRGFQSFVADVAADEVRLPYMNPQTQERLIGGATRAGKGKGSVHKKQNGASAKRSGVRGGRRGHLAP